ncbi:MAG: MFS transporter [Rhodospirillaceae bacterium]
MRIFYGWWVLGGLFVMYAVSNGISTFTLPIFYSSFMDEYGWNQEEVTRPAAIKFLFASIFNITAGFLFDRYSPRPIMGAGALLMVFGLTLFLFMDSLLHFALIYLFVAFGLSLCGLVPSMLTCSRWFTKYRGRAVGIVLMASSVGGAILPKVVQVPLSEGNWRLAMMILAVIGFVGMFLPVLWPVRARPTDKGLTPDGLPVNETENDSSTKQIGIVGGLPLNKVARMPIFYYLLIATGILWFCITGVTQHHAIYLEKDQGYDRATVIDVIFVFFLCAIIGKFSFGWLSDHINRLVVMLLATINLGIGLIILRLVDGENTAMTYAYAVVYGIGFSGAFTMIQLSIAELFAGPTYGRILGIYVAVDTISASLGVFSLGKIRVMLGSYTPAIDLMVFLVVVALGCILAIKYQTTGILKHKSVAAE